MMMQKNIPFLTVLLITATASSTAFALVHGEVTAGSKTNKYKYNTLAENDKTKTVTGSELGLSVLLDPFPVLPIAVGLNIQTSAVDKSDIYKEQVDSLLNAMGIADQVSATTSVKSATLLYGPMVKAWIPTPILKPYLKFSYLMGKSIDTIDTQISSLEGATSAFSSSSKGTTTSSYAGTDLGVGISYAPIKFIDIFLEYSLQSGTTKMTDQSIENITVSDTEGASTSTSTKNDLTDDDKKATAYSATSLRLGIAVGI